jgi:hypothetical protein
MPGRLEFRRQLGRNTPASHILVIPIFLSQKVVCFQQNFCKSSSFLNFDLKTWHESAHLPPPVKWTRTASMLHDYVSHGDNTLECFDLL